jgi:predicted DsbA family dithiol-disulfide isomerase
MAVRLDVWSDYLCPFCYLEEPVLIRLRAEFGDQLALRWRAFELRPDPVPTLLPRGEYLVDIWERAVYPMARERGMNLKLPPVQPRSRLALEAAECAREQGRFDEMHHSIFRAFFEEGRDIGQKQVLLELGETSGLERKALEFALTSGQYLERVLDDEKLASELGLSGVPGMLLRRDDKPLGSAHRITGAQPEEILQFAIRELL